MTKRAVTKVSRIAEGTKDASTASSLEDCRESYDDALSNLQNAVDALVGHDIGTVSVMLSAALQDYSACDDDFEGGTNPMADMDNMLMQMTSNCLAIASLV